MNLFDHLHPNVLSLSLLVPVLLSAILFVEAWRPRYKPNGRVLGLIMLAVAWWSLAYGLELASTEKEQMMFWLKAEYLAIPFISPLMLLLVLRITDLKGGLLRPGHFAYLLVIPIVTMFLAVTNEFHNLYYSAIQFVDKGSIKLLNLSFGPWYYVHVIYSYVLIFYGLFVLVRKLFYQHALFRKQLLFLLLAVSIPLIVFSTYFLGFMPVDNLDPTPFAFAVSGVAMSISIMRFRMLDLMPIAREHVFQSMGDGLVVIDKKQRLVDCNPYALSIFNWSNPPYGTNVGVLWRAYPELINCFMKQDEGTCEVSIEINGETKVFLTSASDINNHKHQRVGKLIVIHDITHRFLLQQKVRLNEEKLRVLNNEKDKLFSIIGHDLKGPISSFISLTDIFTDESYGLTVPEMQDMAVKMNESARSLFGLLENLLQWSRMQREEVIVDKDIVIIKQLFEKAINLFKEQISAKSLTIVDKLSSSHSVFADENMLFMVIRNLLSNAIKFTPRKGVITIEGYCPEEHLTGFIVCDTGIGIPKTMLDSLFVFDDKIGRQGTEGEASTGLGLILCKEFVERNLGHIVVESEVGKGSCFRVVLPGVPIPDADIDSQKLPPDENQT